MYIYGKIIHTFKMFNNLFPLQGKVPCSTEKSFVVTIGFQKYCLHVNYKWYTEYLNWHIILLNGQIAVHCDIYYLYIDKIHWNNVCNKKIYLEHN